MDKLKEMLKMQAEANRLVATDWADLGCNWHRAVWVECAELIEHMGGWKWWRAQEMDLAQAKMELVDIWHFMLSEALQNGTEEDLRVEINALPLVLSSHEHILKAVECVASDAIGGYMNHWYFFSICIAIGMNFDQLHQWYNGKNLLNKFRQVNGYGAGTYRKHWADGREDNEHLVELLESGDGENLWASMEERYNAK